MIQENRDRIVEASFAGQLAKLIAPAVLGMGVNSVIGNFVGDVAKDKTEKAVDSINKNTNGGYEGPGFDKEHSEHLTKMTIMQKDIETVIEKITNMSSPESASTLKQIVEKYMQSGMEPSAIYQNLQEILKSISSFQLTDGIKGVNRYADLLLTFLKNNPENFTGATDKVKQIANFEQKYPLYISLGLIPSAIALDAVRGKDVSLKKTMMLLTAFQTYVGDQAVSAMKDLDDFNYLIGGGKARDDQWGVQDTWRKRHELRKEKELAYQQAGAVLLAIERNYSTIMTGLQKAFNIAHIPMGYAVVAGNVLMMVEMVKSLGSLVTGQAPKLADIEELNVRLAQMQNSDGLMGVPADKNVENAQKQNIATDDAAIGAEKAQEYERMLKQNLQTTMGVDIAAFGAKIAMVGNYPFLANAPTEENPIPINKVSMDAGAIEKSSQEALVILGDLKASAVKLPEGVKRFKQWYEFTKSKMTPKEKVQFEEQAKNDQAINLILGGSGAKYYLAQIQDLENKCKAIQVAIKYAGRLLALNGEIKRQERKFGAEMSYQKTGLPLPALNTEHLKRLLNQRIRLFSNAGKEYESLASGSVGDYLGSLVQACYNLAQDDTSRIFELDTQYNIGGGANLIGAGTLDKLIRLAETDPKTLEEDLEEKNKSLDRLIEEYVDNDKDEDEIYEYYENLLPGYGKEYEEIAKKNR